MTTAVVYNPGAGNFESYEACLERICQFDGGSDCIENGDERQDPVLIPAEEFEAAKLTNMKRLVIVGGDGTVGKVIADVVRAGLRIPVGIIPAGTGNILAKCLGIIPFNGEYEPLEAVEVVLRGQVEPIDIGMANGTPFVLDVGVGPLAMAVTTPDKEIKSVHGMLSYVRPLLKSMFTRPYHFSITAGDINFTCAASGVFVSNPSELGIGVDGDLSSLQNGLLSVILLDPIDLEDYLGMAMRFGSWFLAGTETDSMPYSVFDTSNVRIEAIEPSSRPALMTRLLAAPEEEHSVVAAESSIASTTSSELQTMLDGDPFDATPLEVSILPRHVNMLVPRRQR